MDVDDVANNGKEISKQLMEKICVFVFGAWCDKKMSQFSTITNEVNEDEEKKKHQTKI